MKSLNHLYFLLLFVFVPLLSCNSQGQSTPENSISYTEMPSRRELSRSFWGEDKPEVILVYSSVNQKDKYELLGQQLKERTKDFLRLTVKPCSDIDLEDYQNKALISIGSPESNTFLPKVLSKLLFQIEAGKLYFNQQEFGDASMVAMLPFFPNPLNPIKPITVITGLKDDAIISFLENKLASDWAPYGWGNFDFELYQKNHRILLGFLDSRTWKVNHEIKFELQDGFSPLFESPHFRYNTAEKEDDLEIKYFEALAAQAEKSAHKIKAFVGVKTSWNKINHFLYKSTEQKGLMLHNTEQSHVDFESNEAHTVLNKSYEGNLIGKENELVIRQFLGKPKTLSLERGLAIYFTEKWQKRGYQFWAKKLFESGNLIPLSEVLDENMHRKGSRLLTGCLAASFVEFVITEYGKDNFLEKYQSWAPDANEILELEKGWKLYLKEKSLSLKEFKQAHQNTNIPYLKGFNFAHEGYRIYNGYGSSRATESLKKLSNLGSNAVAIVPYGYMPNPKSPSFLGITNRPGSENDESVIHSATMAKQQGMSVLLKPQIWLRSNSWPGDVEMNSEEDWRQFFHYYHHWIIHYAMLAEIYEMPMFCVGVEFAKSTLARASDWRELIKKVKGIYTGKVTYSANWGEEFENVTFWDQVDFVGLNCYYPLSKNNEASKEELISGIKQVLPKIEKVHKAFQKPIVFTEIGFRSIDAPWKHPHGGERRGAYNGEHQKRCYEAIFESIENKKWCKGILWWKFPCDLNYRGVENGSFTPNNKPAEEVVKDWFLRN